MPESRSETTLTPLTTGTFRSNFRHMVSGGESRTVKIPIPVYVIRHPKGVFLFDSGLGRDFANEVGGVRRLSQLLLPSQFNREDAAVVQLKKIGIPPESVRYIVVSHLHYDHAGGLRDFPEARVVVSRAEWENANVGGLRAALRGIMPGQLAGVEKRLWLVDYGAGTSLDPFDASLDLFGDGSLLLLSTPGHTPGHQSLLVTLGSGKKVLLTGDAVWVRENYLRPVPKGWFIRHLEEKEGEAWATTLRIKKFHEENPGTFIIPGHDPNLWPTLPTVFR